jgi:aspartyl protease family protein
MSEDMFPRLVYLLVLLVAISGWMLVEFRGSIGRGLRMAAAWGMIFVGLIAGYGLWSDIRPQILPFQNAEGDRIEVRRSGDGHFYLTLLVQGTKVRFLVDTGASNVVLSADDAKRLGIRTDGLSWIGEASTANGIVRIARVTLSDVRLGEVAESRLPAYVTDGAMEVSLLGMDFLRHWRLEIDGDRMILTLR